MRRIYVRDGASFVWQWQPKEHIVLEDYPDGVFVRYANCDTVEAPVVQTRREGGKLIADIPPELMQVDKDITIYVCNEGGIIHCHFLSVVSTPKPESYIYEPVEVLRYDTLAERIRLIEEWIAAGGSGPGGGGGIQEEKDPTVPAWAKQPNKPSYTAQEVGALPAGTKIPAKTSDLSNDSGFITKSVADLVNYYTKKQTEDLIAQIPKFRISVVAQLPAVGEELVLYLVPFATAEGQYLEYIWVGGRFEVVGSQKVDLTGYATEGWVQQPYLLSSALPQAIDAALAEAKKSGAFDGADGRTPVKGEDYFTPEDVEEIAQAAAGKVTINQVTPDQVVFPEGLTINYAFGKLALKNGSVEAVAPNGTLGDFLSALQKEIYPSTTQPSVSLAFSQAKAYEVGTKLTPSYSASLKPGSYTYGPDTGVNATAWVVTDTAGNSLDTASGRFPELQVTDGISYKITAKAAHGAGTVPVTNNKNPYPDGQIKAGTKSATSGAVTGYRNTFYGTVTEKSDITSAIIRGLAGKSGKALANGSSFTVTVPVGALRVIIAYPATLRDLTSVKDVNGMGAEIASSFVGQTVDVEGANGYTAISCKVYVLDFAEANGTENKLTVTI